MSRGGEQRPQSKATRHLLEGLKRARGVRDLRSRHLIVCEDEVSAPRYFRAFTAHHKLTAASVVVAGSGGQTQPEQVVRTAIKGKLAAEKDEELPPFHKVWCVIDGDCGQKIEAVRTLAAQHDVAIVVTTPCFEHWVMLHYADTAPSVDHCDAVVSALKKLEPGYDKGRFDFAPIIINAPHAARSARRNRQVSTLRPEQHNPCSEVYLIVEALLGELEQKLIN